MDLMSYYKHFAATVLEECCDLIYVFVNQEVSENNPCLISGAYVHSFLRIYNTFT